MLDAERFTQAAIELSNLLLDKAGEQCSPEQKRKLQERLCEALTMAGLCKVQKQDWEAGGQYYRRAMEVIEDMERRAGGVLDNFLRIAFFNAFRNLEHMHRGKGDEAQAQEIAKQRMNKLGAYEDVTTTESDVDPELNNLFAEAESKRII
jgi:hypothetical protein